MTQDQFEIRVKALIDMSKDFGLSQEDLKNCLLFMEKYAPFVTDFVNPQTLTMNKKTEEWVKKFKVGLDALNISFSTFQVYSKLESMAKTYSIKIYLKDGKVKFGLNK